MFSPQPSNGCLFCICYTVSHQWWSHKFPAVPGGKDGSGSTSRVFYGSNPVFEIPSSSPTSDLGCPISLRSLTASQDDTEWQGCSGFELGQGVLFSDPHELSFPPDFYVFLGGGWGAPCDTQVFSGFLLGAFWITLSLCFGVFCCSVGVWKSVVLSQLAIVGRQI